MGSGSYQTIAKNSIEKTNYCIESSCQHNIISGNTIFGDGTSGIGVSLKGQSNLIYNNTVTGQIEGIGVIGVGNTICGNNISNNTVAGINIQPHFDQSKDFKGDNIICKNWIVNNRDGIDINSGENNTIYANYFIGNQIGLSILWDQTGAAFKGGKLYFEPDRNLWQTAFNNTIYHNNFVDNGQGAADWNWQGINAWDNGAEGNFWSDYAGLDANQNGIGDTSYVVNKPYTIHHSNEDGDSRLYYPGMVNTQEVTDRYPLMAPFNVDKVNIELPEIEISAVELPQYETIPVALLAVGFSASAIAIGACLIVYFKKYHH